MSKLGLIQIQTYTNQVLKIGIMCEAAIQINLIYVVLKAAIFQILKATLLKSHFGMGVLL